ncbi:unnamed protein product [Ectocarpus sp. CCAP 1310/34]|nr:unnamed protein product [Ectocarpus sp. CCAP 1310/34]
MQAVWASAAMVTPKRLGYRLLSDFRAANMHVEKSYCAIPNPGASMAQLSAAKFYGRLDLLQRTKRVAETRAIAVDVWTTALIEAWTAAQDLAVRAGALSHPYPVRAMLMSDEQSGSLLTGVPRTQLDRGVPVEDMAHKPMGFASDTFTRPQQRWATVDKVDNEGYAIVSMFKRLEYLPWDDVQIFIDHRNFAYILTQRLACLP